MAESLEDYSYWCDVLRRNDSIPVSQRNWTDITEALTGLKICARDETCSNLGILPMVVEVLDSSLRQYEKLASDDRLVSVKQLVESGVQFLGNLVTGNEENQEMVWGKCYHEFFQNMMKCCDQKVKNYTCMVMYNCVRQIPRPELVTTSEGISLINDIVHMCCKNQENIEWGVFILESLLKFGFFSQLYDSVHDTNQRIFLLQLIEDRLTANRLYEDFILWVPECSANYLSQKFEESISGIIYSEFNFDVEGTSSQVILVSCLLRLLCLLTAFPEKYMDLRNRISLLKITLVALRETSKTKNKKFFSNVSQFPTTTHANLHHPTHGFKRDLVQLTANLCYRNRRNQDVVREMDSIPLLLDHCNVDDYNPYICQWAIFCLRNVLENNTENQEVIKSLKNLGISKNERLHDAGFVVEGTPDGGIKVFSKQRKDAI